MNHFRTTWIVLKRRTSLLASLISEGCKGAFMALWVKIFITLCADRRAKESLVSLSFSLEWHKKWGERFGGNDKLWLNMRRLLLVFFHPFFLVLKPPELRKRLPALNYELSNNNDWTRVWGDSIFSFLFLFFIFFVGMRGEEAAAENSFLICENPRAFEYEWHPFCLKWLNSSLISMLPLRIFVHVCFPGFVSLFSSALPSLLSHPLCWSGVYLSINLDIYWHVHIMSAIFCLLITFLYENFRAKSWSIWRDFDPFSRIVYYLQEHRVDRRNPYSGITEHRHSESGLGKIMRFGLLCCQRWAHREREREHFGHLVIPRGNE